MAVLWSRGPEPSLSLLPFFLLLLPQAAAAMDGRGRRWRRRRGAPRRCTRAARAARGAVERHLGGALWVALARALRGGGSAFPRNCGGAPEIRRLWCIPWRPRPAVVPAARPRYVTAAFSFRVRVSFQNPICVF